MTVAPSQAAGASRGRRATVVLAVLVLAVAAVFAAFQILRPDRPVSDGPEAGFARDMSTHHAQAVQMSFTVRDRTDDKATRLLAFDIINTQSAQIGMMTAWLDEWELPKADPAGRMRWMSGHGGHGAATAPAAAPTAGADGAVMPGMATRTQLRELERASGRDAEIQYLRLMIAHHRAGVTMAEAVLARTERPRVRRLARSMVDGQRSEIDLMNRMLGERGAGAR
ncbi:DUF305 domain-containing protein [Spirillospora sp. NPDC048911]|uniref:DUF305 domain-containing protein n=1 Tax=Spirillospora sp. NPDC048911 TaxID=3364527 RepID=UPI0037134CA1